MSYSAWNGDKIEWRKIKAVVVDERKVIRLFLVEDQEIFRHGLRSALAADGRFQIVGEARDGESALEQVFECNPDVVLMDIGLPGITGIEATRQIHAKNEHTRVLMLTSHEEQDQVFAALTAGANGYCLKDTSGERLKTAILAVADGAAWLDPRIARLFLTTMTRPVPADNEEASRVEPISPLSQRESEVLKLMGEGLSNREIADQLSIGVSTVRTHVEHILDKLAVSGRTEAAVKAMRKGWI